MQTIFGATGSVVGAPGNTVVVPASVVADGTSPHFIAAMQRRFLGAGEGDIIYPFHEDINRYVQTVRSTVLTAASGTVLAKIGNDPLILALPFGVGRAVHFGTLEYLKADRFGFLLGVDDLFWRSLVWAARKPFVVRGYPRLWALRMDDNRLGWGSRVQDMYNPSLTGNVTTDGTGGPWKVTGYVYTDALASGSADRTAVIADIDAGSLQVSPHNFAVGSNCGDMYWNSFVGPLTDAEWVNSIDGIFAWQQGGGGSDAFPSFSRSMIPHCWDLSNNTGFDLWNGLGFRYVTSIQNPGYQISVNDEVNKYGGEERPSARPFWVYEKPPKFTRNENFPFFFADDYLVGSRAGLPPQMLFLFETEFHSPGDPRSDWIWPNAVPGQTVEKSVDQIQRYTWRFWSSLVPMMVFTHDASNYELSSVFDRQSVIQQVSSWLNGEKVKHVFMEEVGDYLYARNKSLLVGALRSGENLTLTFSGNAATADNTLVDTEVLVFLGDEEGVPRTIPGFTGGASITLPVIAP
jgi:hypothetical protein